MKPNKVQKTKDVLDTAQIRISARLRNEIKGFAALNNMSLVESANLIISTGLGLVKGKKL